MASPQREFDNVSAPESTYFQAATSAREIVLALRDAEAAHEGMNMLSIETSADEFGEGDVFGWIQDHIVEFMTALRFLNGEDRELLLGYYILGKSQTSLAPIH
jgi:hypothetical protein